MSLGHVAEESRHSTEVILALEAIVTSQRVRWRHVTACDFAVFVLMATLFCKSTDWLEHSISDGLHVGTEHLGSQIYFPLQHNMFCLALGTAMSKAHRIRDLRITKSKQTFVWEGSLLFTSVVQWLW